MERTGGAEFESSGLVNQIFGWFNSLSRPTKAALLLSAGAIVLGGAFSVYKIFFSKPPTWAQNGKALASRRDVEGGIIRMISITNLQERERVLTEWDPAVAEKWVAALEGTTDEEEYDVLLSHLQDLMVFYFFSQNLDSAVDTLERILTAITTKLTKDDLLPVTAPGITDYVKILINKILMNNARKKDAKHVVEELLRFERRIVDAEEKHQKDKSGETGGKDKGKKRARQDDDDDVDDDDEGTKDLYVRYPRVLYGHVYSAGIPTVAPDEVYRRLKTAATYANRHLSRDSSTWTPDELDCQVMLHDSLTNYYMTTSNVEQATRYAEKTRKLLEYNTDRMESAQLTLVDVNSKLGRLYFAAGHKEGVLDSATMKQARQALEQALQTFFELAESVPEGEAVPTELLTLTFENASLLLGLYLTPSGSESRSSLSSSSSKSADNPDELRRRAAMLDGKLRDTWPNEWAQYLRLSVAPGVAGGGLDGNDQGGGPFFAYK